MSRVLLTGATGLIGSELGVALVRQGFTVRVLSRNVASLRGTTAFPCELYEWPVPPTPAVEALQDVDLVIHLAGESIGAKAWTASQRQRIRTSRVETGRQLVEAILASNSPPKRFIQASAIGYYGDRDDEWLTETSQRGTGFLADICTEWESLTAQLGNAGIAATALRFGVVMAHGGGFLPQIVSMANNGMGDIPGSGRQWLSWIHIQDLVRLFVEISTTTLQGTPAAAHWSGIFNAVAPEPVRYQDFIRELVRRLRLRPAVKIPAFLVELALGKRARLALDSGRVSCQKLRDRGFAFEHGDLKAMLAQFLHSGPDVRASTFIARQWLPKSPAALWSFFADPANLIGFMPPSLNFKLKKLSTPMLDLHSVITGSCRWHGLPLEWQSEISHWQPCQNFTDVQVHGPYATWRHTHSFESLADGTVMTDHVIYRLPLMPFSGLAAGHFVSKELQSVFTFRKQAAVRLFCL